MSLTMKCRASELTSMENISHCMLYNQTTKYRHFTIKREEMQTLRRCKYLELPLMCGLRTACSIIFNYEPFTRENEMEQVLKDKIKLMEQGTRVIMSDAEYEALIARLDETDHPQCLQLASLPNPAQVGLLDAWSVFFKGVS